MIYDNIYIDDINIQLLNNIILFRYNNKYTDINYNIKELNNIYKLIIYIKIPQNITLTNIKLFNDVKNIIKNNKEIVEKKLYKLFNYIIKLNYNINIYNFITNCLFYVKDNKIIDIYYLGDHTINYNIKYHMQPKNNKNNKNIIQNYEFINKIHKNSFINKVISQGLIKIV